MFWARARRAYGDVSADDEDVLRYQRIASELQESGYEGLAGFIQDIGHRWVAGLTRRGRTLEIGTGAGRHARFYRGRRADLVVSEYAESHLSTHAWRGVLRGRGVRCDARRLPFATGSFKTVISIYNLEHIRELPQVFREVHRVLARDGAFLVALPCEGGLAWNIGRELTTRRTFAKRFGINYDKVIAFEHVWDLRGVQEQLRSSGLFVVRRQVFFPFLLPSPDLNLVACLECSPR
jgi:SAM-dependent methyltransferase